MRLLALILLISVLVAPHFLGYAQTGSSIRLDCPSTRLSWLSSAPDSTVFPVALDSISQLMLGRWELVRVLGGWSKPHPPERPTEIQINRRGKGHTYVDGRRVGKFSLALSTRYGYIRCAIPEQGRVLFNLSPRHKGRVSVCSQTMLIGQDLGDGETFVFKRLTD